MFTYTTFQSVLGCPTVNMGILWSKNQLNGYETVLEMYSKQIMSLSHYKLCIEHLFSDHIYNSGRIHVWFFVTKQVYLRLSKHEQQQCHEEVCFWFAKFKDKCPNYSKELDHMRKTWDLNCHATQTWFSLVLDSDMSMTPVFVCVVCGREFYAKAHLLHHSLVHNACRHCGSTLLQHRCKHVSSPYMTKQEALKAYLHSYHYIRGKELHSI